MRAAPRNQVALRARWDRRIEDLFEWLDEAAAATDWMRLKEIDRRTTETIGLLNDLPFPERRIYSDDLLALRRLSHSVAVEMMETLTAIEAAFVARQRRA